MALIFCSVDILKGTTHIRWSARTLLILIFVGQLVLSREYNSLLSSSKVFGGVLDRFMYLLRTTLSTNWLRGGVRGTACNTDGHEVKGSFDWRKNPVFIPTFKRSFPFNLAFQILPGSRSARDLHNRCLLPSSVPSVLCVWL